MFFSQLKTSYHRQIKELSEWGLVSGR